MPRFVAVFASLTLLAAATTLFLSGCGTTGSIHTAPLDHGTVKLTPHPEHIYLAPFDPSTAVWLAGDRESFEMEKFKKDFQTNFLHQLQVRLLKQLGPTEPRWLDDLPDRGWLIGGEFITVSQGSRALRTMVGTGEGQTCLQTKVYVYDLSVSKTRYLLSFRTGVSTPENETGAGSGSNPAGLSAAMEPFSTLTGLGSGLKLDTTRTAREIATYLAPYYEGRK